MPLAPGLRKLLLTIHLTLASGWIGAVAAYLVLDLTVASSDDVTTLRAAWIAMGLITSWVLVPLAWASLATGLIMSLATKWGVFRHYWVVISLILTLLAVVVLMSEARYIASAAATARNPSTDDGEIRSLANTLLHSIGGLLVLLVIQVLNVYKPRGLTRRGWRLQRQETPDQRTYDGDA